MAEKVKIDSINRCAYRGCNHRRGDEGVILFCLPKKGSDKFNVWCVKAGKIYSTLLIKIKIKLNKCFL